MRRAWVILLLFLAGPLEAQAVPILTGDHPSFTRVTVPLSTDQTWELGRTNSGYGLRLSGIVSFDLSSFFRRITRDRIAGVRQVDNDLYIDLACLCKANVFRFRDRFLVIDISDGVPGPDARYESALSVNPSDGVRRMAAVLPPAQFVLPLADGLPAFTGRGADVSATEVSTGTDARRGLPMPPQYGPTGQTQPEQGPDTPPDMSPLELQVIETLTRAASQGLLDLAPSTLATQMPMPPQEKTRSHQEIPTLENLAHSNLSARPDDVSLARLPGLLAHTSLDEAQSNVKSGRQSANDGGLCWPDAFTNVTAWVGEDMDFGSSIGALRLAAMGELDHADPKGVLGLARGYVFFGFGQEAMQVLQIDGATSRERLAVKSLAAVVDDLPQPDESLAGQAGCVGSVALWGFLASKPGNVRSDTDVDAIVRQFKLLPDLLQVQLGPRLADNLLALEQDETAEAVLQPARRSESQGAELTMAETALAISRGNLDHATATLETMSVDDPRMTPEAVIQLVDLKITQNQVVPDETTALLEAMQFEYRGQPIVTDLLRARIAAMAQNGLLVAALTNLPSLDGQLSEPALNALENTIMAGIVAQNDDMLFLDTAFKDIARRASPKVQNNTAKRLLELGFPDRATDLLSSSAIGSVMTERRYLRAEAAMALDDPALAAAHLAGVDTPRSVAILSGAPVTDVEAADAEWRNGNWSALSQSDDPLLQQASVLEQDSISPVPDAVAPIASGRALLEDAAQTKETLDALMSRFSAPTDN